MKSKKFVLAALVLLAITGLLALAGCKDAAGNGGGVKVYSFPEEVKVLTADEYTSPNHTDGSWTYVEFGEWPQTIKAEGVDVNENKSKTMGMFTYYLGDDGNYYVKAAENANGSGTAYKYSNGEQAGQGGTSTKWFKVEPIVWRVLNKDYKTTGTALLLAEKILTGGIPYYVDLNTRTITGAGTMEGEPNTVYPNNWQYSTIRAWLNGSYEANDTQDETYTDKGFLQTAFTQSAQTLIADTTVANSAASTFGTGENTQENPYACDKTKDKIFLLSPQEATNSEYSFGAYSEKDSARIRVTTDYAKATGAYQGDPSADYGGWWWLRSPFFNRDYYARGILDRGNANSNYVNYTYGGVVPALSISLQ